MGETQSYRFVSQVQMEYEVTETDKKQEQWWAKDTFMWDWMVYKLNE